MSEKKLELSEILAAIDMLRKQLGVEIPKLQSELSELQKKFNDEKTKFEDKTKVWLARMTEVNRILQAAGVKGVAKAGAKRAPTGERGGVKGEMVEYINSLGIGSTFRFKDAHEIVPSGYAGVLLDKLMKLGCLSKPEAGTYRVETLVPDEF